MACSRFRIRLFAAVAIVGLVHAAHSKESRFSGQRATGVGPDTVAVTGVLVDGDHNQIEGARVYLFAFHQSKYILTEFSAGRLSNPRGLTDADGVFYILADRSFLEGHGKYTIGLYTSDHKVESLLQNGISHVLEISDPSNLGKTIDLGDITVRDYDKRRYPPPPLTKKRALGAIATELSRGAGKLRSRHIAVLPFVRSEVDVRVSEDLRSRLAAEIAKQGALTLADQVFVKKRLSKLKRKVFSRVGPKTAAWLKEQLRIGGVVVGEAALTKSGQVKIVAELVNLASGKTIASADGLVSVEGPLFKDEEHESRDHPMRQGSARAKDDGMSDKKDPQIDRLGEDADIEKAFIIKNDFFNNLESCPRQGIRLSFNTIMGSLAIGGDSAEDMQKLHCYGMVHAIGSEVEMNVGGKKYVIRGSSPEPLIFKIIKNKGYVYVSGHGSVTMPDGRTVQLPQ